MDGPWHSDPPFNWPTPRQELLLRAAVMPGEAGRVALTAWKQLAGCQRYEEIDFAASLVLPSVANNLQRSGLDDSWLPQLAGLTRYHWLHNACRQKQFALLLAELGRGGLAPLVAGPLALVAGGYWPKDVPRPIFAGELLLAASDASSAHEALSLRGWKYSSRVRPQVAGWCSETWRGPQGERLSLHYTLLPRRFPAVAKLDLLNESTAAQVNGVACRAVSAEHLLVQLCVRGHWPGRGNQQPLLWLLDAVRMVESQRLDWDRLLEIAFASHALVPVRETMRYLSQRLAAAVPVDWIVAASSRAVSAQEENLLARTVHRKHFRRPLAVLGDKLWNDYARAEQAAGRPATGLGRLQYAAWQLSRAWWRPRRSRR
jgi:hypothetical protein